MKISNYMSHIFFVLIACLVFSIANPSPAEARRSIAAEDLLLSGIEYYDNGDYEKAIHQLSKVLLVDPENDEAREILAKMGVDGGLYGRQARPISDLVHLNQEVKQYRTQVKVLKEEYLTQAELNQLLEEDKEYLAGALGAKEQQNEELRLRVNDIREKMKAEEVEKERILAEKKKVIERKSDQIVKLNTDLYDIKGRLVTQMDIHKEKDDVARKLKQEVKMVEKHWQFSKLNYEDELANLQKKIERNTFLKRQAERKNKKKVTKLRDALIRQRIESGYALNKSLMADYKLAAREKQLIEKEKKIAELKESLMVMDQEASYLQNRIQSRIGLEAALNKRLEGGGSGKVQLIRNQERILSDLKYQLSEAHDKIKSLSAENAEEAQEAVKEIKSRLQRMAVQLGQAKAQLKEKNDAFEVLEQRLKDARERLALVEDMLQDKDQQINGLETQLTGILMRFEE